MENSLLRKGSFVYCMYIIVWISYTHFHANKHLCKINRLFPAMNWCGGQPWLKNTRNPQIFTHILHPNLDFEMFSNYQLTGNHPELNLPHDFFLLEIGFPPPRFWLWFSIFPRIKRAVIDCCIALEKRLWLQRYLDEQIADIHKTMGFLSCLGYPKCSKCCKSPIPKHVRTRQVFHVEHIFQALQQLSYGNLESSFTGGQNSGRIIFTSFRVW